MAVWETARPCRPASIPSCWAYRSAIWGLLSYIALLVIYLVKRSNWRDLGGLARQGFFLVTLIGVMFSAYLTYLEIFVIHAICPWCVASAVVMTILFVLAIVDLFGGESEEGE